MKRQLRLRMPSRSIKQSSNRCARNVNLNRRRFQPTSTWWRFQPNKSLRLSDANIAISSLLLNLTSRSITWDIIQTKISIEITKVTICSVPGSNPLRNLSLSNQPNHRSIRRSFSVKLSKSCLSLWLTTSRISRERSEISRTSKTTSRSKKW